MKKFTLLFALLFANKVFSQGFEEVSRSVGIDNYYEPKFYMGGGAAFVDVNLDGWLDIYATGGLSVDRLYINQGDGTFVEKGDEWGLSITSQFMTTGVSVGDIDNDGDPDLFLSTWVGVVGNTFKRNLLFVNDHETNFFEEKGVERGLLEESWSMGATMTDVNLDGFLDIYVVNYVKSHGNIELDNNGEVSFYQPDCFPNFLYLNNGDGTFKEVSEVYQVANDGGCSLAAAFTDYDNDQKPDLLVANDFGWWATPNQLYKNIGASYIDVSESSNMNLPMFGMGIAIGDYDEDEDLDYYVTNIRGNSLFKNNGDTTFIDKAEAAGVSNVYTGDNFTTGWGAVFYDFDNDTKLDLALTNGYVATEPIIYTAYQDEDKLYKNKGDGTFEDVSAEIGFNSNEISKGLIVGDYDNDGDLDAFVVVAKSNESIDPHYLLYENKTQNKNWLKVKLIGEECNKDAYGSRVILYVDGRKLVREVDGGSSHASHNSSIVHFGLDSYSKVDSLEVRWNGGRRQIEKDIVINQTNFIQEDTSIEIITDLIEDRSNNKLITVFPNPLESSILSIKGEEINLPSKVSILSTRGNIVKQNIQLTNNQVDLSELPIGIYILSIEVKGEVVFKKILKTK